METIFDEIIEHEKKFLGFLIKNPGYMEYVVMNKITPDLFYIDKSNEQIEKETKFLKKLFEVIMQCHNEFGISIANIIDKFNLNSKQKKAKLEMALERLKILAKNEPDFYLACKKIKSVSITKGLYEIAEKIVNMADEKIDGVDIYNSIFNDLLNMDNFNENILEFNAKQLGEMTFANIQQRLRGEITDGVQSHIETLDKEIRCFYYGLPSIVLARPGHGKTTLMLNSFYNNIVYDEKPVFISLEMPASHLMLKLLAIRTGIPLKRILKPANLIVNDKINEFDIIEEAINWLKQKEFYIIDATALTANDLYILLQKYQSKGCKIVYLDYFQRLLKPNGKICKEASDYSEVCMIVTKAIKTVNRRGNMALVMGVQSARVEHRPVDQRLPRLSDLQWTSALEQDAAVIISIMIPEKYEGEDCTRKNTMVVGFPKHRYENAVETELAYIGEINKIGNLKNPTRIEKDLNEWKKEVETFNRRISKKKEKNNENAKKKQLSIEENIKKTE